MIDAVQPCVVYIVDDDDLVRKGLARLMRAGGFTPKLYASPERFLEEVGSEPRACILLDITMPRMSGLQVQAELKARGIGMPVIAVSARDDEDTRRRARDLDARCFFRKPVDDQALLDAIAWILQSDRDTTAPQQACTAAPGEGRAGPQREEC
ncbi:MAG TPA: response regulator [Burkholderiales bacterium]|nr:response regulator [Burkholderiales bacterium]